jgi:hypothetical protein
MGPRRHDILRLHGRIFETAFVPARLKVSPLDRPIGIAAVNIACPICGAPTSPLPVPIMVRRGGRVVFRVEAPTRRCGECGHLEIDETTQEEVIATLERHTRPGDDIVFPSDD